MTTPASQVVVGYDFGDSAAAALQRALALAVRAPFHVLHFVCVVERHAALPAIPTPGHIDYAYTERVERELTDLVMKELLAIDAECRVHFCVHVRIGKPVEELLDVARSVGADLIIVGSRGLTGVERLVLGSVSERVVREAGCTVQVARPKTYERVELLQIVEVQPHLTYVPPHRYTYEERRLERRPAEWPLY
jgi:nucleotide-binding universal stress UspA family protein